MWTCPLFSVKTSLHGNKVEQNNYKKTIVAYMLVGNNNKNRKESSRNKRKMISSRLKLNIEIKWLFGTMNNLHDRSYKCLFTYILARPISGDYLRDNLSMLHDIIKS